MAFYCGFYEQPEQQAQTISKMTMAVYGYSALLTTYCLRSYISRFISRMRSKSKSSVSSNCGTLNISGGTKQE